MGKGNKKQAVLQQTMLNEENKITLSMPMIVISQMQYNEFNNNIANLANENNKLRTALGESQKTIDDLRSKNISLEVLNETLKRENEELRTRLDRLENANKEIRKENKELKDEMTEFKNKEYYNKLIRAMKDVNKELSLEKKIGPTEELVRLRKERNTLTHYINQEDDDGHDKACSYVALLKQLTNLPLSIRNKFCLKYSEDVIKFYEEHIKKIMNVSDYSDDDVKRFDEYFE